MFQSRSPKPSKLNNIDIIPMDDGVFIRSPGNRDLKPGDRFVLSYSDPAGDRIQQQFAYKEDPYKNKKAPGGMTISLGFKPSKVVLLLENSKESSRKTSNIKGASDYSYCNSGDWFMDPFNPLNFTSPLRGVLYQDLFNNSSDQHGSENPFSELRPPPYSETLPNSGGTNVDNSAGDLASGGTNAEISDVSASGATNVELTGSSLSGGTNVDFDIITDPFALSSNGLPGTLRDEQLTDLVGSTPTGQSSTEPLFGASEDPSAGFESSGADFKADGFTDPVPESTAVDSNPVEHNAYS